MNLCRVATCLLILCAVLIAIMICVPPFVGTRYAPGYSESVFDALPVGAPEESVVRGLGKPLAQLRWEGGQVVWEYTERRFGLSYDQRWAAFKGGKLTWKRKYH